MINLGVKFLVLFTSPPPQLVHSGALGLEGKECSERTMKKSHALQIGYDLIFTTMQGPTSKWCQIISTSIALKTLSKSQGYTLNLPILKETHLLSGKKKLEGTLYHSFPTQRLTSSNVLTRDRIGWVLMEA